MRATPRILRTVLLVGVVDYWCFMGAADDNVSISVSSTGSDVDLTIALFGPPDYGAMGAACQDAEILNVALAVDGLSVIGVLDFEAGKSEYALTDAG